MLCFEELVLKKIMKGKFGPPKGAWNDWSWNAGKGAPQKGKSTFAADGMPRSYVTGLPENGEVAFKDEPTKIFDFLEKLRQEFSQHPEGSIKLNSLDISQNDWETMNLDALFAILSEKSVQVERLKAFKCGVDDGSLLSLGTWLQDLDVQRLPSEVHLSHNKITLAAFQALFKVIEEKYALLQTYGESRPPIWMRVEGNGIEDAEIRKFVEEGRAALAEKGKFEEMKQQPVPICFPVFHSVGKGQWKPRDESSKGSGKDQASASAWPAQWHGKGKWNQWEDPWDPWNQWPLKGKGKQQWQPPSDAWAPAWPSKGKGIDKGKGGDYGKPQAPQKGASGAGALVRPPARPGAQQPGIRQPVAKAPLQSGARPPAGPPKAGQPAWGPARPAVRPTIIKSPYARAPQAKAPGQVAATGQGEPSEDNLFGAIDSLINEAEKGAWDQWDI